MKLLLISTLFTAFAGMATAIDMLDGFIVTCDKPNTVALTFDDGPSPFTMKLLDTLAKYNARATFFQIGVNVIPANYSILQAIWDGGHQIALHTNTHPDLNLMTEAQILDEVTKTIDALKASPLGIEPNYVRPPFGNENANAKMVMDSLGLTTVVWSVDSNDWRYADNVAGQAEIVSNILGPVKANDVILAHDIHEFSVDKMDEVIRGLVEKGFILETIGNCKSNAKPYYRNKPNNLPNKSITASYIPAGKGDPSSVKVSGQSAQTASSAFTDRIGGNVVATAALLAALVGGIMTI